MQHPELIKLLRNLLEIMDNLERALSAIEDMHSQDAVAEGVRSIHRQLTDTFYRYNLRSFTSLGRVFDPMRHEALGQSHVPGVPVNQIVEEIRRGYLLGETLFRPAQVLVNTEKSRNKVVSKASGGSVTTKRTRAATRSAARSR